MPLVVLVDESGIDLLVALKYVRGSEAGPRLETEPLGNVPLVHLVTIGVFQNFQEQIDLRRQIDGLAVDQRHALGVHQT